MLCSQNNRITHYYPIVGGWWMSMIAFYQNPGQKKAYFLTEPCVFTDYQYARGSVGSIPQIVK